VIDLLARLRTSAKSDAGVRALADGLALAAAQCDDAGLAVDRLREAAALRARLADFRGSADALLSALSRRPEDSALVGELEALLGDLDDRARLHAALELHLAASQGEARLPIVSKLLGVAEALGDEAAVERWTAELRRLEPAAAARVDVNALARTIGAVDEAQVKRDLEAAEARVRALALDDDVLALRAARRKLGELYRDLGRRAEAYEQLSLVLSEEPSNVEVMEALVPIAEGQRHFREAAELLERLSHHRGAAKERAALLYRVGEIYLVQLRDKEAASERYLKAVDLDDTHAPTLRRLIDYFFSAGDDGSAAEMAVALDDAGAFAVPETSTGTRARGALAAANAGDLKRAARLAATLDESNGATALAHAAAHMMERADDVTAVVTALRVVCGGGGKLAAVRKRLLARGESDPGAAAIAARLA